jgi:hypothetical protein
MASQNKQVRFGPVALTITTTTNILNPGTTTGGTGMPLTSGNLYFILKHVRIGNKTASNANVALWLGLTGANTAGTEAIAVGAASAGALTQGVQVPANSYIDWYGYLRMDAADFLVGGASAATALTFEAEGEIGVT